MEKAPVCLSRLFHSFKTMSAPPSDSDEIYGEWRRLVAAHSVSGKKVYDARLVAAMRIHGIQEMVTFNTADFERYSEIRAHSPQRLIATFHS